MNRRGFTLLEIMVTTALFTIVMSVIFSMGLGFANSAEVQEIKIITTEEARRALMILAPRLRQAARNSINWDDLPGDNITFRMATDLSGNGTAVDADGAIELTEPLIVQRDVNDANEDGITMTQLVLIDDDNVRVLANSLETGPAPEAPGADVPANVGFWVRPRNNGLEVTVRAEGRTRRGRVLNTVITEYIVPRN